MVIESCRQQRVGWRSYAAALLAVLLRSPEFLPGIFTVPAPLGLVLLGVAAGLVAGIFEEMGWTGFAVPLAAAAARPPRDRAPGRSRVGRLALSGVLAGRQLLGRAAVRLPAGAAVRMAAAYRVILVATHDRTTSLPVVMLMHASLSASAVIFARPGLSDAQSLVNVLTWAALLWVAASAVVIADRRQRDPLGREVLAHDSAR
jgi:CAAX protease family protein